MRLTDPPPSHLTVVTSRPGAPRPRDPADPANFQHSSSPFPTPPSEQRAFDLANLDIGSEDRFSIDIDLRRDAPLNDDNRPSLRHPAQGAAAGTMGLAYNTYLNSNKIYGCKSCKAHLANHEDIISRNFRGQHGKAYLFHSVVNIEAGEANERSMTTGRHVVRDITCRQCKETVGWKYDKAYESSEKYKEGKFILEAELLCNVT